MTTIPSTTTTSTQSLTGRTGRHHHPGLLDTAAKALGLSKEDLVGQLKSGQSLEDVATSQGVSHDDLATALKAGLPPDLAAASDTDSTIDAIISKKGMPERPQGPRGPQGPPPGAPTSGVSTSGVLGSNLTTAQQATLDKLSSLLGTDSNSLLDSLRSGSSTLSDLVTAKGVNQDSLASILQDGLLFDAKF